MTHTKRFPHAPTAPIPELAEFLSRFRIHFSQKNSASTFERYVTGLLTELPNKNCDTLAAVVPGTNEQRLNNLLTDLIWDEQDLNRQRIQAMLEIPSEGDAALIFDDSGFAKKGAHSVGVARQYSGTLGKVDNCQVTVNCHYAERTLAWPVATRLYVPREWAEDSRRREKAHVPAEITFQTKAEIALSLLDEANACGVPHACVVADSDYGDNPNFLNGLEEGRERYCVAVRADFGVALSRQRSPVQRAEAALSSVSLSDWRTIGWREGSAGELRAKFTAVRCRRVDGSGNRHIGWLIGQRPGRGQTGERKYFWSNFPLQTPLVEMVEYAHRRYWVEQFHEEAKGELGWDEFQGRRWDAFHRHAMLVMLSYSFLVWTEWRERQQVRRRGRVRAAFSPATRSAKKGTGGGAPVCRRLDEDRSHAGINQE